ncbi:hypothetical protein ABZP36_014704 [Zizania latifolia]
MAQLDASSDRAAADGHIHVIDMPQLDANHGSCHVLDRAGPPDTSGRSHVVIDIDAGDGGSSTAGSDDAPCCAVCMEPLEWVAVGPCGHRVVCSVCAARIRSGPQRSKLLCCICRALCPSVVVTKAAGSGAINFSKFPAASSQDGRVGEYWYCAAMSAYFDDEQQYKAAKATAATTHLKPPPPSSAAAYSANGPNSGGGGDVVNAQSFMIYLFVSAMFGASYGVVFATEATGWGARAAIVSGAVALTLVIACALWYMNHNTFCGPLEDEHIAH